MNTNIELTSAEARMHRFADELYQVAVRFCNNDTERGVCDSWYNNSIEFGTNVINEDFDAAMASLNALSNLFNTHIKYRNQELSMLLGSLLLKYYDEFQLQFGNCAAV